MDSATPFQPWTEDSKRNVKSERELVDDAKSRRENVNPKHTQTASYIKESVTTTSNVPCSTGSEESAQGSAQRKDTKMDSAKIVSMQKIVENTLSLEGRQRVSQLLEAVEALSGTERLLLYLRLPTGVPPHDPLKQPINPLGSRAELQQTVTWIQTHLEVDPDVSLPKQDVYDEYIAHCMSSNMKPLSTADFGKVMKQVYPTVRPRRLGTRGNSRYCYAGLRKKIKLEVPQLPDLGDSSKEVAVTSRETERIICDWAETKLGAKFANISELSQHLQSLPATAPPGPLSGSPPPSLAHPQGDDPASRHLMKQLKRKIQTQTTPSRTKKNKGQEVAGESPPSTSYIGHHTPLKHESELLSEGSYGYQAAYVPLYEPRGPYPPYGGGPPRAHPPVAPPHPAQTHPAMAVHEYRPDPYVFEPVYARDLTIPTTVPSDTTHNLPINLSSDASLDLSTERTEWQRRRPPDPPATRLPPLPGKKLILETYQSETQSNVPRTTHTEPRTVPQHVPEEFPRTEYLPKKMRAAEILGGKLAAARHTMTNTDTPSPSTTSSASAEQTVRPEVAFLEDPKNLTSRSKSTAAALVRKEQEAASPTQSGKAPPLKTDHTKLRKMCSNKPRSSSPNRVLSPDGVPTPDSCCGLDEINIKTGMICAEKHSEILNRERVISICNIDKHDLDDYLNEGNSQEHEEELLKYFQLQREAEADSANANKSSDTGTFLDPGSDPHDEHSQGKNEKISQLRELLAKNLKNQSGSSSQKAVNFLEHSLPLDNVLDEPSGKTTISESAFKPVVAVNTAELSINGVSSNHDEHSTNENCTSDIHENGTVHEIHNSVQIPNNVEPTHLYNGSIQHEPQSPTTRTQQYDFVPISDGCHSPAHFNSKSPLGFNQRGHSPVKVSKPAILGRSLQASPISHSTAASPFVSPRNTPVPRSRLCPRPIPKHNGRRRRNPLSLAGVDNCAKQFAMPVDQKFMTKTSICSAAIRYSQPMSAPPSPNILSGQYKNQVFPYGSGIPNGNHNLCLSFLPNSIGRESINGDITQPLSADPLSSEVSQFFQDSSVLYRPGNDTSLRSQSVPLKQGTATMNMLSYNNTPVGSVPPTPVPNEFCDFGQLGDTCDISKAGLNPETLDKIYDAIDSNNAVLSSEPQNLLNSNDTLTNGCDPISSQGILMEDQLNSLIPNSSDNFNQAFTNDSNATSDVEEYLKRTNSIEFDLSDLVSDRNKFCSSRSVPSTPLPFKRTTTNLQIDPRRSRELFTPGSFSTVSNGISSKSVPSTPQLAEERNVFSYSNRDFLINGNSVEVCSVPQLHETVVDNHQGLTSPLHDILGEDTLDPLTPAADLLADLDKMDGTSYDL